MKKILLFTFTIILCCSATFLAYANESEPDPQDSSQPRLMVTSYKVADGHVSPSKKSNLEITIKNFSRTKSVSNIKLSIFDESGEIKADGVGTIFVNKISANGTYTWKLKLVTAKTAVVGEHKLTINMEYEDKYYTAYSETDNLSVNVKQSVEINYDGLQLPVKVIGDDTQTVDINVMNTGKSTVRNCKIDFDIEGLDSGGTLFIGEIPAGESKAGSANLRVSNSSLGEKEGKATISYEDEFGESYKKEASLSTFIEKKVELVNETETKKENKYPLWWLFLIIGCIAGGGIGFGIPTVIHSKKQRKEDELRL